MSNTGWNPAGVMQTGGGLQDQQQVGGVKLFDPTQFQTPHQQQPVPADQQNFMPNSSASGYFNPQNQQGFQNQAADHGSSWNSWGNWNWSTDRQNAELSGQPTGHANFDAAAGSNVDGVSDGGGGQQDPNKDQQQFAGQFNTPEQYQNGGYAGGELQIGAYQDWQNDYYYDQGQWVPQDGAGGGQGQPQFGHEGQYYFQGQHPQQTMFDPSAWNNHSSGDTMHMHQWGNSYDPQDQQAGGYGAQQSPPKVGNGESHPQTPETQSFTGDGNQSFQSVGAIDNAETPQSAEGSLSGSGASGMFASLPVVEVTPGHPQVAPPQAQDDQVGQTEPGHTRQSSIDSNMNVAVAGYFGHGDSGSQSESSPTASPRRRDGASALTALPLQHLRVTGLPRNDSGISNASLQTVNSSADEDTKDGVDDVDGQMGQMHLDDGGATEKSPNPQLYDHPGDFSGFGNYGTAPPQPSQLIQQGRAAEESREADQQSPVLNDWEIVPAQPQSSASHSRTSSLDDGIKFTVKAQNTQSEMQAASVVAQPPPEVSGRNPVATHSSSTQDSESFTAISSSSSTGESYSHSSLPFSDRGSLQQSSASSTPFTSPGAHSVLSHPSPASSLQSSPMMARELHLAEKSPLTMPSPPAPPPKDDQRQQQSLSSSASSSAVSSPKKSASQSDQSSTKENNPEAASVGKASEDQDGKPPGQGTAQTRRPPPSPGPRSGSCSSPEKEVVSETSSRCHHSAFHPVHSHRAKHNMSPATTLWDNLDSNPTGNILLAPAAPLIIPSLGTGAQGTANAAPIASSTAKSGAGSLVGKSSSSSSLEKLSSGRRAGERASGGRYGANGRRGADRKEGERSGQNKGEDLSRSREDDNRSLGSLDELDAQVDDDSRDRSRGYGRDPRYDPYYDRPSSRSEVYRDDLRKPPRDPYRSSYGRDYRDPYYDERYDRPRSRQDEERSSRPSSGSMRDMDRPTSRPEYDRDRDAYYQHNRYRGYPGYDAYGQEYYYDERDRYYRYYTESRYRRGYAEEMGYYGQYDSNDYYSRSSSRPSSRMDRDKERDPYRQGYGSYGGYDAYGGYYDHYQYPYPYYQYPQYEQGGHQQGRMTPPKYLLPHVRVCFGPTGQLVTVLPNRPAEGQPATVEIHDLQVMLQDNAEVEELRAFPGPLVRNETHKNDVLLLCQKRAKECADNIDMVDRESAELIWRLLELLLKQNGTIIGTDIADLLLTGHEPTTHDYTVSGMRIIPSADVLDGVEGDESSRGSSPAVRVSVDRTVVTAAQQLEEATDRFRHLLLYGRKKEALDLAMKRNLWGHALFLASKMDNRTHASVMTRFANTAMRMNDPLQTLYQLMSGRQPASVTNMVDERWGDWRPHLAMILSNHSSRPELDKKSIITLGDTLATKHCLHASHFCYLMAQVEFGSFTKKTSKIVLIGSNHNLPLEEFANNSTIQCTEVYEYAQTLGSTKFCLPQFQLYKFLYACRLAEYGLAQEAFHYCEVIAHQVLACPARYHATFVSILYTLASRLKHCDPQKLQEGHDSADPAWLQQLYSVCQNYEEGSLQYKSGSGTPMFGYGGMTPSSEGGEVANYSMDNNSGGGGGMYQQEVGNYTGTGYNYQQAQYAETAGQGEAAQKQFAGTTDQYGQYANQYTQPGADQYNWHQDQQQQQQQQYDPSHYQQQWQSTDAGQAGSAKHAQGNGMEQATQAAATGYYSTGTSETGAKQQQQQHQQQQQQPPVASQSGYGSFNNQQTGSQQGSLTEPGEEDEDDNGEGDDNDVVDSQPGFGGSQFDYFSAVAQQHQIVAPPHRYRTTSTSSSGSTGRRRRRTMSGSSTGSVKATNTNKSSAPPSKPAVTKKDTSGQKGGGGGGGWFNGLFSKFGRGNKNEMILPDDKNPSIVWDPVEKKWKNKDGDEDESMVAAPPPKDTDLMGKMSARGGPVPTSMGPAPAMNDPPGANRFSIGRGRGARGQYVDVLNPGNGTKPSSSVPTSLFNVLPTTTGATSVATTTTPKLFDPSGAPSGSSQAEVPASQASNLLAPPNHDAQELGDSDSMPAQSASTSQPPGMPMMFNPSQLSQSGGPVSASSGPGLKYGNRRVYPK